jgi:hypothetical protein
LSADPWYAHVTDLSHPDIRSQVECARRRLALIQLEITDHVAFWWQENVMTHNLRNTVHAVAPTWRQVHVTPVLQLVTYSPALCVHDVRAGREVAYPSYRGFESDTFIRFGILTTECNVVSFLGNVNAATAARPDRLLIGTAQYQYQTALASGTTQIFRMMEPCGAA